MSFIVYDLQNAYQQTFGGRPYVVEGNKQQELSTAKGSQLATTYFGKEVWLPIRFVDLDPEPLDKGGFGMRELLLPYSVIKIDCKKNFVKTELPERSGSVKEQYNIDDYSIDVNGFVIDEKRVWPEQEIMVLKRLFEFGGAVRLDNALTNIFLGESGHVVVESISFPEVVGGRKHIRPFSMKLSSDSIFELEIE